MLLGWLPGAVAYAMITTHPKALASKRLQEDFGSVTTDMLILCTSYKFHGHAESALADVALYGEGKVARDCKEGLRDTMWTTRYSTVEEFLTDYAHEWGKACEPVKHAIFDVRRAMSSPSRAQASADLSKAMERVMKWVRKSFDEFITAVSNRATYLTLAAAAGIAVLFGMVPVFRMVGWGFHDLRFAFMVLFALVGICFVATEGLLHQRPSTFAAPPIPPNDPRLPKPGRFRFRGRELPTLPFCILVGLLISTPTLLYFITSAFGGAGVVRSIPVLGAIAYADVLNVLPMFFGIALAIAPTATSTPPPGWSSAANRRNSPASSRRCSTPWATNSRRATPRRRRSRRPRNSCGARGWRGCSARRSRTS